MRNAFEAWAQRDGHIVRRREDKPDEYLVFETQRRWVIWQAAWRTARPPRRRRRRHSKLPQALPSRPSRLRRLRRTRPRCATVCSTKCSTRSATWTTAGIEGVLKVIQGLKKKQKALAEDKTES